MARSRKGSGKSDDDVRLPVDVEGLASDTVVDGAVEVALVVEVFVVVDVVPVVDVVVCLLVETCSVVVVDSLAGVVFLVAAMLLIGAMSSRKRSSEWGVEEEGVEEEGVEEEVVEEEVEVCGEETEGAVEEPSNWSIANQVKSWFLSGAGEEEEGSKWEVREDRETTLPLPGRS